MMARSAITMTVRQQPARAQVVQENNPKNRKPIDPPPIVELKYENDRDDPTNSQWLVSPRTFMMVTLIDGKDADEPVSGKYLIGQTVSSLHRLKDNNNKEGGFFVFGDLSARKIGEYRLRFSLFDTSKETEEVVFMGSIDSEPFPVMAQRDFGSMSESTSLTKQFSDQGVKLRVRKDNRAMSSLGTKRTFHTSPTTSSSPTYPTMYSGAVQDHHYSSTSPEIKRQRTDSDYGHQSLYHSISLGESTMPHYTNTIPSSTRQWGADDQHSRSHSYYSGHSPLGLSIRGGLQSMHIPTNNTWHNMPQQSALPSPSPSVSTHATSYGSGSSQQPSSMFGDPGANSSIPRNYSYGAAYQYAPQSQYQAQHSGDVQSAYSELQLSGSSLPDTSSLGSTHNGYSQAYMPTGELFSPEGGEVAGPYGFVGDPSQKY